MFVQSFDGKIINLASCHSLYVIQTEINDKQWYGRPAFAVRVKYSNEEIDLALKRTQLEAEGIKEEIAIAIINGLSFYKV